MTILEKQAPINDECSLNKSCESCIWDQYLSKTWNGKLVICNQYLIKNIKGCLNPWNQETLKPRNQETETPQNQKTKEPKAKVGMFN